MIVKKQYHTSVEDFTKEGRLNLPAILKLFENAGNAHSDKAGDSPFNYDGHSFAWVITEWKIEVSEYPHYSDKIEVETWSEGLTSPLVASRNFLMYKNGGICARGTSKWVRIDMAKGRLVKIEKELIDRYGPEDKTVFEGSKIEKIQQPEKFDREIPLPVRRCDIDFNNHIHNVKYLDYALETLPLEIFKNQVFKGLRISYKTAAKEGEELTGKYAFIDGKHIVVIYGAEASVKALVQFE